MKNKKKNLKLTALGFTLIELLAVIIILAIILVIAVPQVLKVIDNARSDIYGLDLSAIKKATQTYVESGKKEVDVGTTVILLSELVDNGLIDEIKDPKDKSSTCDGYVEVNKNSNIEATYTPYLKCGNNYTSIGYVDQTLSAPANIHQTTVPGGYTGIYTIEDLNNIRNSLNSNYILMNNLDFNSDSSYSNSANKATYTTGAGWTPIGNSSTKFTGQFDGNNYVIKNLYINLPGTNYVGLFGYISGASSTIQKLGIEGINVTGNTYTGGLLGYGANSSVQNCYSTGRVIGNSFNVGGLVGGNSGSITNSYSAADVTGTTWVGGLVGSVNSNTNNNYAAGNVTATTGSATFGKIFGGNGGTNNYYSSTSTLTGTGTASTSGTSVDANYLKSGMFITYTLGWDVSNIWDVSGSDYPKLGGTTRILTGTQNNITKIEDLYSATANLSGTYNLMNDLDFNDNNSYRNMNDKTAVTTGMGWTPIGNCTWAFAGQFNGNGHVIKNLYINQSTKSCIGLFGEISGTVQKVGIENVNVIGKDWTGGLAGIIFSSNGKIQDSYSTGLISGNNNAGGLAGYSYGTIQNSYSTVSVTGVTYVGGLLGYSYSGSINNSYTTGNVVATLGSANYGKFVGYVNGGTFTNDYYSDAVTTTGTGTECMNGTSTSLSNLKSLTSTGLNTWDTTTIWRINAGSYPTLRQ